MNKIGIYHLFGENVKAKRRFLDWCKKSEEFCESDIEKIETDLYLPVIDNTAQYMYFHVGNILGWLEDNGYYIGLPLRGKFKYVTVVHFKDRETVHQTPLYSNSGVNSRVRALELGIIASIKDLETKLK